MESESLSVVSDSLWSHGLYSLWNSPGQNTGMGNLSLLQGIFSTQGSNPGLPYWRQILYQLSHKNTGVGSRTQELNWSLLHCRWILYQLSFQGSPPYMEGFIKLSTCLCIIFYIGFIIPLEFILLYVWEGYTFTFFSTAIKSFWHHLI